MSLPWPLALPWDEAFRPWQVGLVVSTVVMGTAGVWYLRRPVNGKVKAKADGAKHKKAKKVKKQADAPPMNTPERLAASSSAASSSAASSSAVALLERLSVRSEEAEDTVADDGEWQVVPDRSPKSKGSSKQRRKQQPQPQPQSPSPTSPSPTSPSPSPTSPSSSPSKAVAKAAGARDKGGAAGKGGAAKGASGGAVDEARAAHNGASCSSRMPPHASQEDDDLQLAMALSRSLHEGQGRQGTLHDAHEDAFDEGWSLDGRSGGAHEAPEPRLEAPEPPPSPTYAARTRASIAGGGGSAGGAGAGTGAVAGVSGASVAGGVVPAGNSSPLTNPADATAAARVTVELSLLDESERKQLLDELLRDKALGKRVDRPCDRLREGMARVDGGQLSKAAFDAALIGLAGPEKVERVMNHVRSPSDARSDASTVRAKNSPTR